MELNEIIIYIEDETDRIIGIKGMCKARDFTKMIQEIKKMIGGKNYD